MEYINNNQLTNYRSNDLKKEGPLSSNKDSAHQSKNNITRLNKSILNSSDQSRLDPIKKSLFNVKTSPQKTPWKNKTLQTKFLRALEKAKIIGKGLVALEKAGFSGKTLNESYWVETFAESHLYNHKSLISDWKEDSTDLSYEEWSKGKIPESEKLKKVTYCNKKERAEYLVSFEKDDNGNIILTKNNKPYDTKEERTEFSGNGVAIFVVGSDQKLYCGTHDHGKFHHSSFLSGASVLCAGEIIIKDGKVEAFTSKTGHYQSGRQEVINFVKFLKEQGLDLSKITYVEVNFDKETQQNSTSEYCAKDILDSSS